MTIAELHGKLSPDRTTGANERMEDLLTSDVFGTMKYIGWQHGFLDWFLRATPAPINPSPPPIENYLLQGEIKCLKYSFWPRLKNNREPDLALLFCFETGNILLILVEAKYLSGTSDWESDEEVNPLGLTGNQIADQVQGIKAMGERDIFKWFEASEAIQNFNIDARINKIHLFLTIHTILPKYDYEYATKHISDSWPIDSYWLSWTSLAECVKGHLDQKNNGAKALLKDMYDLLKRKGLIPFKGFSREPWRPIHENSRFWIETWWALQPLILDKYRSFWNQDF